MSHLEGSDKARYVSTIFARISRRYDFMNTVMTGGRHHAWRRQAVRMASPTEGGLALDTACGTGDFALELARWPLRRVIGVDFSEEMVLLARRKARELGLERVEFQLGNVLELPFADNTFDCVTSGFALRNVASLERCLAEMCRVARPGGRLVVLELTPLPPTPLAPLVGFYLRRVVPLLGTLLAGNREAYSYLGHSVRGFPAAESLSQLLRQVGFARVSFRRLALGAVAIHVAEK